jgi:DNA polymerase delta subunit 1
MGHNAKFTRTSSYRGRELLFYTTSIINIWVIIHDKHHQPNPKMAPSRLPQKRVLGDATAARNNVPSTPISAKKRKLEPVASSPVARFKSSQNGPKGKLASSQPSHFETEVLEKMTQDMAGLKKHNSEKDQQWKRPELGPFDPKTETLCFQQIEIEKGTLQGGGGRSTCKLYGVTEVSIPEVLT